MFNRLSVQRAIRIAQNRLKLVKSLPDHGLALFCGRVRSNDGVGEVEVSELLSPPMPVTTNYYRCDSRFHIEIVHDLFNVHKTYGYIIVTSVQSLVILVRGTERKVMFNTKTNLQTETRRGGQSANRIARIRNEKRAGYKDKIVDMCVKYFQDVEGIICAGNAELPIEVQTQLYTDTRISKPILGLIKISTDTSVDEVIEKSMRLIQEKDIRNERNEIEQFEKYLRTNSDILVFSKNEIQKYDKQCLLRYVLADHDIKLDNTEVKKIEFSHFLSQYDGAVGILYYTQ